MVDPQHIPAAAHTPTPSRLQDDEKILIVDDYPDFVVLLQDFLSDHGFSSLSAGSAAEVRKIMAGENIALILLDIGLPDISGLELLPVLKDEHPDLAIIMLTAVTDLQTALDCIRRGADDYIAKPIKFSELLTSLQKILEKRRLTINNRLYQKQIEQARFRSRLLHELTMQMNTAYLSMTDLDEILQAILVGITAGQGLRFDRAFLALFDEQENALIGKMAIGPRSGINNEKNQDFNDLMADIQQYGFMDNAEVNRIVDALHVRADQDEHILIRAARKRHSINIINGKCPWPVPPGLIGLLQEESFVIVPLYSPRRSLGVIIADHFISREPITDSLIHDLESFASQASLAIEHCHLYMAMEKRIQELKDVTRELEQNRDLLIEAERYSAVGHMAAQLAHKIRNPVTAIGGTARLLAGKTQKPEWLKFLNIMTNEVMKIERTLEDLFNFVETVQPEKKPVALNELLSKSLMLYYPAMKKQKIVQHLHLPESSPCLLLDRKLMHQAFVHLVRNSIEAMPEGGELILRIEQTSADMIEIIFEDTGPGIADAHIDLATDPFFTTKTFGTGLGLTLVERIIREHQGSFTLERRQSGGSRSIIRLPNNQAGKQQ